MSPVVVLPQAAEPLLGRFGIAFTPRTFQRVLLLFVGSVLTLGRHTVSFELAGYKGLSAEVVVTPKTPARVSVSLEQIR